jgi:hypothetical protein
MPNITVNLSRINTTWVFQATPIEAFISVANEFVDINPYSTTIASGKTATLDIPASNTANVSYRFEVYQNSSVEDFYFQGGDLYASSDPLVAKDLPRWQWLTGAGFNSQWYTGSQVGTTAPTSDNKLLTRVSRTAKKYLIDPITAIMPNAVTDLRTLANSSVTSGNLDAGARRVAELMLNDPALKALLPKGINPRGGYLPASTYFQNDAVTFNGEIWIMLNASPQSAIAPGTNPLVWERYVTKGSPGGTGAEVVGFNSTSWTAQDTTFKSQATARGDALDLFNSISQPDLSSYATQTYVGGQLTSNNTSQQTANDSRYGRLGSLNTWSARQTFNGGAAVLDRPNGDNGFDAANTRFVQSAISAIPTSSVRSLQYRGDRSGLTSLDFVPGGNVLIRYGNAAVNVGAQFGDGAAGTGLFTPTATGDYEFSVGFLGTFNGATINTSFRLQLWNNSAGAETRFLYFAQPYDSGVVGYCANFITSLTSGVSYAIRVLTNSTGSTNRSIPGTSTNHLSIWKLF